MKQVITTEPIPIKIWTNEVEDGAMIQIKNLAKLPFLYSHIAIMPDVHQGYGMVIGGVIATNGAIIPNAVGVDIGCGMIAVKSNVNYLRVSRSQIKEVMGHIRKNIPVGLKKHDKPQIWEDEILKNVSDLPIVEKELNNALCSLGTLGGGNHFIELQKDKDNDIWIMIHSGSRNLGKKIADEYHQTARKLNMKWHSNIPTHELAFLPLDSNEGQEYFKSMLFAVHFAFANRKQMLNIVMDGIREFLSLDGEDIIFNEPINIAHNYASLENHFGENVLVHRKGATSARKGEMGIIPGSQGTASYIVRGLGNPHSFQSCSHGAGRKLSRTAAQNTLSLEEEQRRLDDAGVIHGIRSKSDLDEAAGAYKDIDEVMENQTDLVEIVEKLLPIAVVKG